MSYQEKRNTITIVTGIAILAVYCIYAFNKYSSGVITPYNLKSWASAMLGFIVINVVANVIIQVVFHVLLSVSIAARKKIQDDRVDEKEIDRSIEAEMVTDEMDNLIGLKSARVAFAFIGIGFILGLLSLVLSFPPALMLNILFISFSAGTIAEGGAQLYYYRRGIRNA